jgi:hypothetical protein
MFEELFGHDVADAIRRPAATRVLFVVLQVVAVIERQFLAGLDAAQRHDPDAPGVKLGLAVRRATVVDEPRRIPSRVAIEIVLLVQREDTFVVLPATPQRLALGDFVAGVFDDARAGSDVAPRKPANAVDMRRLEDDQIRRGRDSLVVRRGCCQSLHCSRSFRMAKLRDARSDSYNL